jgi:cyclase
LCAVKITKVTCCLQLPAVIIPLFGGYLSDSNAILSAFILSFHQIKDMFKKPILLLSLVFCCSLLHAQGKYLETIKITDSIYVFKPKIDWSHGNGVAIIGPDGVFFIDTYMQTTYAAEAIRRLKKITKLPVTYVLNTHWHYDHVMGNDVFKKAFPDCKIIMHDSTYRYMEKFTKPKVAGEAEQIKSDVADLKKDFDQGKTSDGVPLTGTMKPFWQWVVKEAEEYARDYKGNRFVNADITFSDTMTFHWSGNTLQVINPLGKGHSEGDAIVWIPEKKIVITGDIVVGPIPYASYINTPGMIKSLQSIIDLQPAVVIPGHGEILHDMKYVTLLHKAFSTYVAAAEKAYDNKTPIKEALNMTFPEIDIQFTGNDDLKKWAYKGYFINDVVSNTYRFKRRK